MSQVLKAHRKVKVVSIDPPAVNTTSTDGQNVAVDTLGFEEMLLLCVGGAASATLTLNIDIQHSDEATANFATIAAASAYGTGVNPRLWTLLSADIDNTTKVAYFDLSGLKRFIKPVETLNGNSIAYGLVAVLFGPDDSVKTNNTNQPLAVDATA